MTDCSKANTFHCILLPVVLLFLLFSPLSQAAFAADLDVNDTQSLNSGTISYNNEYIGHNTGQTGTFNQNGGTNTVSGSLSLGHLAGSDGNYNLSGNGTLSALIEFVGHSGTGIFTQSAGTNTNSAGLIIGDSASGDGTYHLNGGTLTSSDIFLSNHGTGLFNQAGGTNTIAGALYIGNSSVVSGTYNLSGGALNSTNIYLGAGGIGIFDQTGGTNTVSGDLDIGWSLAGANGTYTMSGGTLNAGNLIVGDQGTGTFMQTGGTSTVLSDLDIGSAAGGSGTYTLSGGTLNAGTVNLLRGVFNQTGGHLNATSFIQGGGEVQGNLENRGTFTYQSGLFNGRLYNYGAVSLEADFTAADGLANYSSTPLTVETGRTVTLNGAGLDNRGNFILNGVLNSAEINNEGSFVLNGIASAGELDNQGSFVLNGLLNGAGLENQGTFTLNGTMNAGDIENEGTFVVNGSLNGAGLDNQGTFTLNGSLNGSGTILNNRTGIFQGTGTAVGTFVNSGTLRPGNSVGTLNIVGSFTQTSTGILNIEVASPASYDKLTVTGAASLAGTITPTFASGFTPNSEELTFLTATDGISGTFGNSRGNLTPVISWGLEYDPYSVSLIFASDFANPGLNLTSNQHAVGAALNALSENASGDMATVLTSIANLPTAPRVADSLSQISAEKISSFSTLSFAGADLQKRILAGRIYNLRTTAPGLQTSAISGKSGVFFDPAGIVASKGSTQDQSGYDFTIGGFGTGIDFRIRDDLLAGVATGYNHTDAHFRNSGGSVSGDTLPVNAYVAYLPGAFYAYGSLGYSLNMFNTHRNILFSDINRTAKSSVSGNMLNAYAEAGYDFRTGSLTITPLASLSYSSLWVNGFSEENAGDLALKVASQNAQSLQSGLGAKVSAPFHAGSVELVPRVFATWQHELANDRRDLDARFAGGGPMFTFRTDSPNRDFGVFGADISMPVAQNLAVRFDYSVQAGAGDYTAHYLGADLKWMF